MANYILSEKVHKETYAFYPNVSKKYQYTYSEELMLKNINDAYNAIYRIENEVNLTFTYFISCGLFIVYKVKISQDGILPTG